MLDPVDARFLRSEFICKGGIVQEPGTRGKTVSLDAVTKRGRIEDILRLIIKSKKPLLTGAVNLKTKILIPPGPDDVLEKLRLDGEFGIVSAEFTDPKLTERLQTLSQRAQGISKKEEPESPETVASNFRGRFKLANGIASFSHFSFMVPGALVRLAGTYSLRSGVINMSGTFRMQARLSETQSGVRHWLLKPFDPIFAKEGAGFVMPIKIRGTKDHPEFAVEMFHKERIIH
jgi:AsmA-like C-terminal region